MENLLGETAWISGASGGIGRAIALDLAKKGANIAVCYQTAKNKAQEIVDLCRGFGVESYLFEMDVIDQEQVRQVYQDIQLSLGTPRILIHAAGGTQVGLFQDLTMEQYDRIMDTHVRGAVHMIQSALPAMISHHFGRIVLLSSIWGESGGAGEVIYSAAKGAIQSMTKALAKEVALSGITVNAVAPGAIDTPLLQEQLTTEERLMLADEIPVGRLGEPEEIAHFVGTLCLPQSKYITGQVIHINGGWYT